MEKGKKVGSKLRALAKDRGLSQAQLEEITGINHSTMSGYWSNRLGLGLANGRKLAQALMIELSDLGLSEEEVADDELTNLRHAHAALEETVRLLTGRVEALERRRATPRRVASARKQKAV